jgi:hypothetical protein
MMSTPFRSNNSVNDLHTLIRLLYRAVVVCITAQLQDDDAFAKMARAMIAYNNLREFLPNLPATYADLTSIWVFLNAPDNLRYFAAVRPTRHDLDAEIPCECQRGMVSAPVLRVPAASCGCPVDCPKCFQVPAPSTETNLQAVSSFFHGHVFIVSIAFIVFIVFIVSIVLSCSLCLLCSLCSLCFIIVQIRKHTASSTASQQN